MSKSDITLGMEYGGHGKLLEEIVRACMHSSNPSSLVRHVLMGVCKARTEAGLTQETYQERVLNGCLETTLRSMSNDLKKREEELYSEDVC